MRLFVAILLNEEVRAALVEAQRALSAWKGTARWVDPAQLHLTLKFLGDTQPQRLPSIVEALNRTTGTCRPFELRVTGCGCFPPRGPVRIVWTGAEDDSGQLAPLVSRLETELAALGCPEESRPFSPHLTIGRVRDDRSNGGLRSAVAAVRPRALVQPVAAISLMSSTLSAQGPTYREVARSNLA